MLLPLAVLALLLSGCTLRQALPDTRLVGVTPTPEPTALATEPPTNAGVNGYDLKAGNCVDAAAEAIELITNAGSGTYGGTSFTMDMRLTLDPIGVKPNDPRTGCAATGKTLSFYRHQAVSTVQLKVYALTNLWPNAQPVVRRQWLEDVLNVLIARYPKANVTINTLANNAPCGSALISFGSNVGRQINDACN